MLIIIPTIISKHAWLYRTLWGLAQQTGIGRFKALVLVDRKPWDNDPSPAIEIDNMEIEVRDTLPPFKFKRQHAMINEAIAEMDPLQKICVMDDDYWCLKTNAFEIMLSEWNHEMIVVPKGYASSMGIINPHAQPRCEKNDIIYPELGEMMERSYNSGLFGMHPCCGNPKIMLAQTWRNVGGFPSGYQHYWFADTELYLRAKHRIVTSPIHFVHAEHTRNFPEMFSRHNAQLFMERIGKDLDERDPFRRMAEKILA